MAKNLNDEEVVATTQEQDATVSPAEAVPVKPEETQYNRYNMALPRSFSIYNEDGSVIYRGEVESVAEQLKQEVFGRRTEPVQKKEEEVVPVEKPESVKKETGKEKAIYDKKRGFFLFLPMLLFAIILAAAVLGAFDTIATQYVAGSKRFWVNETYFGLLDPALGYLKNVFAGKLDILAPATSFFSEFKISDTTAFKVEGYVLLATTVIYMILAIEGLIVSICGLAGKKKENGYRKAKLGFMSIVMFVCAIGMIICTAFLAGVDIKDFLNCFTAKDGFAFGYGIYALVAIPVLTFICSCVAYRKVK